VSLQGSKRLSNSKAAGCSAAERLLLHPKQQRAASTQAYCTHIYFNQVQLFERQPWCQFVLWTLQGTKIETILTLKKNACRMLAKFHNFAILPDLSLPRYSNNQAICELFLPENSFYL